MTPDGPEKSRRSSRRSFVPTPEETGNQAMKTGGGFPGWPVIRMLFHRGSREVACLVS